MISATPGREVRQELYLNTQYEKARQDPNMKKPDRMLGFFIAYDFLVRSLVEK